MLRQGCLYQYADAKETRLLQVMPLSGAKVLDLGQDVTVQYEESRQCYICASAFTTFNRRHHCRNCHRSCCSSDASEYVPVPASGFFSPVRVCNNCSRLCVAYLEILPISFDVGGMQRGVFTLPLHDAPFTVGLKSRVQEMWLSFSNRSEAGQWIQALLKEGAGMIRPPKDLLATKGLYDTEDWTRIAGDVGAILLQCKTEEELLEAAHVLSTVQIASMPPETRSILRDMRAIDAKTTRFSGGVDALGSAIGLGSQRVSELTDTVASIQDTFAKELKTHISTPSLGSSTSRILQQRRRRSTGVGSDGLSRNRASRSVESRPGTDTSRVNTLGSRRRSLSTPPNDRLRQSSVLRAKATRAKATLENLPAIQRARSRAAADVERKKFGPKDEVFILDSRGRVRRTGTVLRRAKGLAHAYEVKTGDVIKIVPRETLFCFPTVGFKWRKGGVIGEGQYGIVYSGFNMDNGTHIAIKQMPFKIKKSRRALQNLYKEVRLMQMLDHPNIVRFLGCQISLADKAVYIFMEQISGGSLQKVLISFGRLSEKVARGYTRQILMGLQYLHVKGVVHRDLKCGNVLITTDGVVKLADFGVSKQIKDECQDNVLQTAIGSPYWMAPEVVLEDGYGRTADVWSLGCTIIEMVTATHPWKNLDNPYTAVYSIAQSTDLPFVPEDISSDMKNFIHACLRRDKATRPSCKALWTLPWLRRASDGKDSKAVMPSKNPKTAASKAIERTVNGQPKRHGQGSTPKNHAKKKAKRGRKKSPRKAQSKASSGLVGRSHSAKDVEAHSPSIPRKT